MRLHSPLPAHVDALARSPPAHAHALTTGRSDGRLPAVPDRDQLLCEISPENFLLLEKL